MICDNCKNDRLVTDFIKNQKFCYHCEYQIKLKKVTENRTEKVALCRMCGDQIVNEENSGKNQRTVFCSRECAQKGHKQMTNNHWTKQLKVGGW